MNSYHKIQSVFKRDPATNHKNFLEGEFTLPEFEYLATSHWVFTEQVDGTNIRVNYDEGGRVTYGGRTDRAQIPATLLGVLQEMFQPGMFTGLTFYGEGYGPKIQKGGGNYRENQSFVLFDIYSNDMWLERVTVEEIAESQELDVVPVVGEGTLYDMIETVKRGNRSKWGKFWAEGLVARPAVELKTRRGERIITKVKHKDFLRVL